MSQRSILEAASLTATARERQAAAIETLAACLAAAGRGEPVRALEALAAVVLNRLRAARTRRAPPSWGLDLSAAVQAPGLFPAPAPLEADDPLSAACRRIAARAAAGSLPDPTGGALHWHRVATPRPQDAEGGTSLRLGSLVFIRPAPAPTPSVQGWTAAAKA